MVCERCSLGSCVDGPRLADGRSSIANSAHYRAAEAGCHCFGTARDRLEESVLAGDGCAEVVPVMALCESEHEGAGTSGRDDRSVVAGLVAVILYVQRHGSTRTVGDAEFDIAGVGVLLAAIFASNLHLWIFRCA